jgi:glutaredoxin
VKELLSHAGVPFEVRNVEADLEAYRDLIALGFRTVPVTIIGRGADARSIVGFNEPALLAALDPPPPSDR